VHLHVAVMWLEKHSPISAEQAVPLQNGKIQLKTQPYAVKNEEDADTLLGALEATQTHGIWDFKKSQEVVEGATELSWPGGF